jgi:hypothetical protein
VSSTPRHPRARRATFIVATSPFTRISSTVLLTARCLPWRHDRPSTR